MVHELRIDTKGEALLNEIDSRFQMPRFIDGDLALFISKVWEYKGNHQLGYPDGLEGRNIISVYEGGKHLTRKEWIEIRDQIDAYFEEREENGFTAAQRLWGRQLQRILLAEPQPDDVPKPKPKPSPDGYVYILQAGPFYKIGKARDVDKRLAKFTPKLPFEVRLIHTIATDNARELESYLHRMFKAKRTNGEWFALSEEDVAWLKTL